MDVEYVLVNLACLTCDACRHVCAQFNPDEEDFGLHPVEEHFLMLWSRSHRGPIVITSYETLLVQ